MFWTSENVGIIVNSIVGLITVFAIFRAPITALNLQKKIENSENGNKRKLSIFKTLMATRANASSLEHVQALNMIDIEFYNDLAIKNAWDDYRKHLNSPILILTNKNNGKTIESII